MNNKAILTVIILLVVLLGGFLLYRSLATNNQTASYAAKPSVASTTPEMTVTLTDSGFTPQTVTIKAGQTVVWANQSGQAAAINSAVHPTHLVYPPLNLGEFASGTSLSLSFDQRGTYNYHNHLNPSQTGTVVVE